MKEEEDTMEERLTYTTPSIGYAGEKELQLVTRTTVASAEGYMIRLLQLGVMEGALGEMEISPLLKPLLEAMHHVLAGGEVEIKLHATGNVLLVQELERRLEEVVHDFNVVNQHSNHPILPRT
jgi:hypothetical protein